MYSFKNLSKSPIGIIICVLILAAFFRLIGSLHPIWIIFTICVSMVALVIRAVWVYKTHIKQTAIKKVDYEKLNNTSVRSYGPWICENLIGQDHAVNKVLTKIELNLKIAEPGRTLGRFMLIGPTGTGKTYFSKLLGNALFDEDCLLHLRMNELKSSDGVKLLLGSEGIIFKALKENPYRVILFDELDKCHRDVQHALYAILDEGIAGNVETGELIDFSGCVIMATCNSGIDDFRNIYASDIDENVRKGECLKALLGLQVFEAPFLSRWDDFILMDHMDDIDVAQITLMELAKYWRKYNMELKYTDPKLIVELVTENQNYRDFGVRQLFKLIQDKIDANILEARRIGYKKVRLKIDGVNLKVCGVKKVRKTTAA